MTAPQKNINSQISTMKDRPVSINIYLLHDICSGLKGIITLMAFCIMFVLKIKSSCFLQLQTFLVNSRDLLKYFKTAEYLKMISDIFWKFDMIVSKSAESSICKFCMNWYSKLSAILTVKKGFYLNFSSNLRNTISMQITNPLFSWKNIRPVGWTYLWEVYSSRNKKSVNKVFN